MDTWGRVILQVAQVRISQRPSEAALGHRPAGRAPAQAGQSALVSRGKYLGELMTSTTVPWRQDMCPLLPLAGFHP